MSEIQIKVTADVANAKQGLQEVTAQTEELGAKTVQTSSVSSGSVLQVAGSVMSLKNGLKSLTSGNGGVGSILQIGGAVRGLGTGMKVAGGAGGAAALGMAAGWALAAAAVVGVGAEVGRATMGTETWKEKSTGAVNAVIGMWGKATTAVSDFWKQTAVGSFFEERKLQQMQAEVAAAKEQVEETERINNLTGDTLKAEVAIAEAAGDAAKVAQLYARARKEATDSAAKEKAEAIETANILQKNGQDQDRANKAGEKMEREEGGFAKAREIAKEQKLNKSQEQALEKAKNLIGPATGARIRTALTDSVQGRESVQQHADPGAMRQLENSIVNLAKSGIAMETIVTTLGDNGLGQEEIVSTLESLEKRLPQGFADKLLTHIKPGVIAWN